MSRKVKTRTEKLFSSGVLARTTLQALVADLDPTHSRSFKTAKASEMRSCVAMRSSPLDSYAFKQAYQLENFFKKFTFKKDVYTVQEREKLSIEKFMQNQNRLHSIVLDHDDPVFREVRLYAKGWIERCLKDYDTTEHLENCYFGSKASVGVPSATAHIGQRLIAPISGSVDHIEWFRRIYLQWHHTMRKHLIEEYTEKRLYEDTDDSIFSQCDQLDAVLVNKTYKSLRMIVPNTTIGSLYTNGLGKVMQKRLFASGYDIRMLQEVHRNLARMASRDRNLVTGDQTLASDNIIVKLIEDLFPLRWAKALLKGRIGRLVLPDKTVVDTETMSTMGIGFTFPMQMVLFLGILHGIRLARGKSVKDTCISAYGDDIIYDTVFHEDVCRMFPLFGLVLNEDKTFSSGPFRESCGGDFHNGTDVRPAFFPEGDETKLSKRNFEALLYKTINSLRTRWSDSEVPETLNYLYNQVEIVSGHKPFIVPTDYSKFSGICCSDPHEFDFSRVKRNIHGRYTFECLVFKTNHQEVKRHEMFLLDHLRTAHSEHSSNTNRRGGLDLSTIRKRDLIDRGTFVEIDDPATPVNYRSKLTGRRLRRKLTLVSKDGGSFIRRSGSTVTWT